MSTEYMDIFKQTYSIAYVDLNSIEEDVGLNTLEEVVDVKIDNNVPYENHWGLLNSNVYYNNQSVVVETTTSKLIEDLSSGKLTTLVFINFEDEDVSANILGFTVTKDSYLVNTEGTILFGKIGALSFPDTFVPMVSDREFSKLYGMLSAKVEKVLYLYKKLFPNSAKVYNTSEKCCIGSGNVEYSHVISCASVDDKVDTEPADFEDYLSINIQLIQTKKASLIWFDSIYLPKAMRSQGIFTSFLKIIKEFMDTHHLGSEIILIDSSDTDSNSSSEIANSVGLMCNPNGEVDHQL